MKEIWRQIKDFSMYDVSNKGRIRSRQMGYVHLLKSNMSEKHRYFQVTLCHDSRCFTKLVHILVLETFIGSRPDGCVGNHKDGVPSNCEESNLEWITKSEDILHAIRMGLCHTKVKEGEVWLIKKLLWYKFPQKIIAKMFKIAVGTVSGINTERCWQHVKFESTEHDELLYKEKSNWKLMWKVTL